MTRDPLLVMPDTSLAEIAEVLLDPHRRPVVVVDAERRPVGVVSSEDVLAALVSVERLSEEDLPAEDPTVRRFPASAIGSNIGQDLAEFAHAR